MTFDYGFDAFKTPLTKCLCGASNCKGYLGQKPTGLTDEEWNERLENMPCEICRKKEDNYDNPMLLCDTCNQGFHTFCLNLVKVPDEAFFCEDCLQKQRTRDLAEAEKLKQESLRQKKKRVLTQSKKAAMEDSNSDEDRVDTKEYNIIFEYQQQMSQKAQEEIFQLGPSNEEDITQYRIAKRKNRVSSDLQVQAGDNSPNIAPLPVPESQ